MAIKFTKHALHVIKLRKIETEEIYDALYNPDKITEDKLGNTIAQKKIGDYLLRIVYLLEEDTRKIITAYKTSKLSKYK